MRKTYYKNRKHKRAGVATVISDKIDLGQEIFIEKKEYFIITESLCPKNKRIINEFMTNNKASKFRS